NELREAATRGLGGKLSPESDSRRRGPSFGGGGGGGRTREERFGAIRRGLTIVVALIALFILAPTAFTYINPGHVGIVIHRAGGGVDRTPLGPGLHMRNPLLTQIEEYPTYM